MCLLRAALILKQSLLGFDERSVIAAIARRWPKLILRFRTRWRTSSSTGLSCSGSSVFSSRHPRSHMLKEIYLIWESRVIPLAQGGII